MNEKRQRLIQELTIRPVIAAVRDEADALQAAESPVAAVFLLSGSILTLPEITGILRRSGKLVFMHMDLCDGLGRDAAAVQWCARNLSLDGMISTRWQLLKAAGEMGLLTIQRMFLMGGNSPDMVELLPGLVPKAIREVRRRLDIPVIAGGMVTEADEVEHALSAGALAVSTSDKILWRMGI